MSAPVDERELDRGALSLARRLPDAAFSSAAIGAAAQRLVSEEIIAFDANLDIPSRQRAGIAARALISGVDSAAEKGDVLLSDVVAACAFVLEGNTPSATFVVRRILAREAPLEPGVLVALGIASPRHADTILPLLERYEAHSAAVRSYVGWLRGDDPSDGDERTTSHLRECLVGAFNVRDVISLGMALEAAKAGIRASARGRGMLAASHPLREVFLQAARQGRYFLLPSQQSAFAEGGAVYNESRHLVFSAPTSAGKTLVGLATIALALNSRGRVAVYVAPLVALARQVTAEAEGLLPTSVEVVRAYGAESSFYDKHLRPDAAPCLLVATPERLDWLLRRRPDLCGRIDVIVVDEAHVLSSPTRGLVVDAIITRLKLQRDSMEKPRIALLTAVIDDSTALVEWLGGADRVDVLAEQWRPTARRLAFWRDSGDLRWLRPVIGVDGHSRADLQGAINVALPAGAVAPDRRDNYGRRVNASRVQSRNTAELVRWLAQRIPGPTLVVASTKPATRAISREVAAALGDSNVLAESVRFLRTYLQERYPYLRSLYTCLGASVAYHNSAVPFDVRGMIEDVARRGDLACVVSTTSLSEGVDLPFRTTVVADWIHPGPISRPFSGALVKNIAGRCGRAGSYLEGDTVIVDNPVGPYSLTAFEARRKHLTRIVLEPVTMGSAVPRDATAVEVAEAAEAIATQSLGALTHLQWLDDRFSALMDGMFAASDAGSREVWSAVRNATVDLLGGPLPLAVASSPLRITALGEIVRLSPLGPTSSRAILSYLGRSFEAMDSGERILSMLEVIADGPEARRAHIADVLRGARVKFPVRRADVGSILDSWIAGIQVPVVMAALPAARRSVHSPKLDGWLSGEPNDFWEEQLERTTEFVQELCASLVPRMLRAAHALAAAVAVFPESEREAFMRAAERFELRGASEVPETGL